MMQTVDVLTYAWNLLTNIWVLLFIIIIIIPVLQRYLLNRARRRILARISRERRSQGCSTQRYYGTQDGISKQ